MPSEPSASQPYLASLPSPADLTIRVSDGEMQGHLGYLSVLSTCAAGLPRDATVWDLTSLRLNGEEPVTLDTLGCWLAMVYMKFTCPTELTTLTRLLELTDALGMTPTYLPQLCLAHVNAVQGLTWKASPAPGAAASTDSTPAAQSQSTVYSLKSIREQAAQKAITTQLTAEVAHLFPHAFGAAPTPNYSTPVAPMSAFGFGAPRPVPGNLNVNGLFGGAVPSSTAPPAAATSWSAPLSEPIWKTAQGEAALAAALERGLMVALCVGAHRLAEELRLVAKDACPNTADVVVSARVLQRLPRKELAALCVKQLSLHA